MKARIGILIGIAGLLHIALLILLAFFILVDSVTPKQYVTNDPQDYGNYVGNHDNSAVVDFINSFFPQKIESDFANVRYSYRAQKNDTYAFETYLEFYIEDPSAFQSFITDNIGTNTTEFPYAPEYRQYVVSDIFSLSSPEKQNAANRYAISYAKIGKILYCEETQQIIYIAMGVYDGGIAKTDFLNVYFNRFSIDPVEYHEQYHKGPTVNPSVELRGERNSFASVFYQARKELQL